EAGDRDRVALRLAEHLPLHRKRERRLARQLAAHTSLCLAAPDRPAHAVEFAAQLEHVTRLDHALETAIVDAGEERELPSVLLLAQHGKGAGLSERLDDQDAGHDRPPGEVTLQVPLVSAHRLPRHSADTRSDFRHLVDQEEQLALRVSLTKRS